MSKSKKIHIAKKDRTVSCRLIGTGLSITRDMSAILLFIMLKWLGNARWFA
ncbi:MAG: hypothetical protein LUE92_07580 [Clostridiales bacterium]|nr:hypothetical protein [Clostridiales bacterium]